MSRFWNGFEKRASEISSAQDLEEPLMAGFHIDPNPHGKGGIDQILKGGVDMDSGNDPVDAAEGYGESRSNRSANDYPGGI